MLTSPLIGVYLLCITVTQPKYSFKTSLYHEERNELHEQGVISINCPFNCAYVPERGEGETLKSEVKGLLPPSCASRCPSAALCSLGVSGSCYFSSAVLILALSEFTWSLGGHRNVWLLLEPNETQQELSDNASGPSV